VNWLSVFQATQLSPVYFALYFSRVSSSLLLPRYFLKYWRSSRSFMAKMAKYFTLLIFNSYSSTMLPMFRSSSFDIPSTPMFRSASLDMYASNEDAPTFMRSTTPVPVNKDEDQHFQMIDRKISELERSLASRTIIIEKAKELSKAKGNRNSSLIGKIKHEKVSYLIF
jgi:tryptophanyl-tRNA synthetase